MTRLRPQVRRCSHPAACLACLGPPQKLEAIGRAVRDRGVDAVLYLDRLDSYRLDTLDRKVSGAVGFGGVAQHVAE